MKYSLRPFNQLTDKSSNRIRQTLLNKGIAIHNFESHIQHRIAHGELTRYGRAKCSRSCLPRMLQLLEREIDPMVSRAMFVRTGVVSRYSEYETIEECLSPLDVRILSEFNKQQAFDIQWVEW